MTAPVFGLAVVLALSAAPGQEVEVLLEADVTEVEFGRPFALTVVRRWRDGSTPEPWDDGALDPLVVRLDGVETSETGEGSEERRRYTCHAFTRGKVRLASVIFRAYDAGGVEHTAETSFELTVRSALAAGEEAEVELPGDLAPVPGAEFPWLVTLAAAALLSGGAILVWRRLARAPAGEPTPEERAVEALARLRAADAADGAEVRALYDELAYVVRRYVQGRFDVAALEMTTEELLGADAALDRLMAEDRDGLGRVLADCDLVKFAGRVPDESTREGTLDEASGFVRSTGDPSDGEGDR